MNNVGKPDLAEYVSKFGRHDLNSYTNNSNEMRGSHEK